MRSSRIAVVETNELLAAQLSSALANLGHRVQVFRSGAGFLREAHRQTFDLLVLNWESCEAGELDVLRDLDDLGVRPAVLLTTDRGEEENIVRGLNAGADDYVIKPCQTPVLLARIAALLRRGHHSQASARSELLGGYRFDHAVQQVQFGAERAQLTAKEFVLGLIFFRNAARTLSRDYLLERVWGRSPDVHTRTVDVHVARLRAKLQLRSERGCSLTTVYGLGYRLELCDRATRRAGFVDVPPAGLGGVAAAG